MEMRRCSNGHYFDASNNTDCPYCKKGSQSEGTVAGGQLESGRTMPLNYVQQEPAKAQSIPVPNISEDNKTSSYANPAVRDEDDGRTVALIRKEMGIDPVVGWLICIEGKEKGKDYRLHSDNNFVGRSDKMDVCIRGDETISRENHAVVSYDGVDRIYYLSPGDGRSIIRLNDKALFQTAQLSAYDKITIGNTVMMFQPFCGVLFDWKANEDEGK